MAKHSRRDFLKTTAIASMGYWVADGAAAEESTSPNERIRFACIGIAGGKGGEDLGDAAKHGDIVAMCDIDDEFMGKAADKHPQAEKFHDFRELLDKKHNSIDAVTVTIPDHNHAAAAISAMRLKKHCFCQKPLARTIYEARRMSEVAKEMGVVTQMGNQVTASDSLREAAAVVQSGVLGTVKEVHVYSNRPIWPQGIGHGRPKPAQVPKTVDWQSWLGVAQERPYGEGYHPFAWRAFWAFGTGALGDMACHTFNMPYMALDLKNPTSVVAETAGHNKETFPAWSTITFEFPANDKRAAVLVKWYDGGKRPPRSLLEGRATEEKPKKEVSGCIIVGDKGKLFAPGDYCDKGIDLFGKDKPKVEWVKSPGHFDEYALAIKGGKPAVLNFPNYAGGLTETILLGNLAVWAAPKEETPGKKIEWDAKKLVATNAPEVMSLVKPEYRKGYEHILQD